MEESDSRVNVAGGIVQQEVDVDLGLMSEDGKHSEGAELVSGPWLGDPLGRGLCPQTGAFPDDAGEPGLGQVRSESVATLSEATVSEANEVSAPKVANDNVLLQFLQRMDRDNKERDREYKEGLEANKKRLEANKERLEAMDKDNKQRLEANKERLEAMDKDSKERLEAMDKGNKEAMRKLHTVIDERLSAVNNRVDEGEKNLGVLKQVCDAMKDKASNLEVRIIAIESDITERRDVLPDERNKEIMEDLLTDKQGALDSVEAQVTRQEVALNKHRDEVAEEVVRMNMISADVEKISIRGETGSDSAQREVYADQEEIQSLLQFKEAQLEINRKHREELAQLQLACYCEGDTPPGRLQRESDKFKKRK
ncbi:ribonuclease Y-like [Schistocerca gregaria]|uniref:ribonuclease Y-like n=1 Tax=Schistocerca gregaria TaxID=7010 RepID=UPI00211DEC51|nr:ribonuclease Y-like [Schistocerca gregaria]